MSIGKRSRSQVDKVRKLVFDRDDATCVVAHTKYWASCAGGLTIQHRIARGMGSSSRFDAPKYLLSMCAYHNQLDVSDAVFHHFAVWHGWSVPRWVGEQEMISRIPVSYADGWHILDGSKRLWIADSVAADLMGEVYGEL